MSIPDTWTVTRRRITQHHLPGMYLGRNVHHDSRNLAYPWQRKSRTLTDQLWPRHAPVLNQGSVGSCTGNAETGALSCDPDYAALPVAYGPGGHTALDEQLAVAIYSAAETIDGDGPYPPNDNGSSGPSAAKAALGMGLISGYLHCLSLQDVLDALEEHPVCIGSNWYDCVMPSSRVLTTDLRWIPIEKLVPGDEIIGFDETPVPGQLRGRRYRRSTILANDPVVKQTLTFYYDLGGQEHELTVSEGHLFLVRNSNETQAWRRADQLRIDDVIYALVAPYEPAISYEAGWLAGFFDGEGSVGTATHKEKGVDRRPYRLDVSQRIGPTLDALKAAVSAFGFDFQVQQVRNLPDPAHPNWNPLEVLWLRGGRSEILRFLGTIRPERLVANGAGFWEGQILSSKTPLWSTVTGIRRTGRQELRAIGTSTGTLIVEGLLSHNSFDQPGSSGLVEITPGASVRGGHEYLCRGKSVADRLVFFDNSWGAGWGKAGSFAYSWDTLDRLLAEQGDGTVSLPLTAPAPQPVPVPQQAADAALHSQTAGWTGMHHVGQNAAVARDLRTWYAAKGF